MSKTEAKPTPGLLEIYNTLTDFLCDLGPVTVTLSKGDRWVAGKAIMVRLSPVTQRMEGDLIGRCHGFSVELVSDDDWVTLTPTTEGD